MSASVGGGSSLPRDSSLDSGDLHQEKLTSRKISHQEEKKLTRWTPSKNLGNYILCHVRKVSNKGDEDDDVEGEERSAQSKRQNSENIQNHSILSASSLILDKKGAAQSSLDISAPNNQQEVHNRKLSELRSLGDFPTPRL